MVLSDSDDDDESSGSYVSDSGSEEPKAAAAPTKKKYDSESDEDDISDSDEESSRVVKKKAAPATADEEMDSDVDYDDEVDDGAISDSDDEAPVAAAPKKKSYDSASEDEDDISDSDDDSSRLPPKKTSADVSGSGSDADPDDAISDSEEEPVKSEPKTSSYLNDDDLDADSDGNISDSSGVSTGKKKAGSDMDLDSGHNMELGSGHNMELDSGHDVDMGGNVDEKDDAISDSERGSVTSAPAGGEVDDDAISDSAPAPSPPAPAPKKKSAFDSDSNSDDESTSENVKKAPVPAPASKKKSAFDSDSDSDDSSSEPVKKIRQTALFTSLVDASSDNSNSEAAPAPKKKSAFDSDSDSDDSSSEPVKKIQQTALFTSLVDASSDNSNSEAAPAPKKKSAFDSDSDSDEDSTSEKAKKAPVSAPAPSAPPAPKKKSAFDSDSDSDDSSSEPVKQATIPAPAPKKKLSAFDSDSDSDDSNSEPVKKPAAAPTPVTKEKPVSDVADDVENSKTSDNTNTTISASPDATGGTGESQGQGGVMEALAKSRAQAQGKAADIKCKPLDGPAKNRADAFTEAFSAAATTSAEKESTMDEDDGVDSEVESVSTADYDSELETEQRVQQSVADTGNEPKQAKIHVEQTREPDALPVPGKERASEGKPLDGPAKNRADAFTEAFSAAAATSAEKESTMDEDDGVDSEVESVSTADYDSELETEQRVQQSVADTGNEPKQAKIHVEQTREPDALPVPGKERASEGKPLDGPAKNRADAFTEAFSAAATTSAEKESTMDEDDGVDSEVESVSTADYDSELETEQRVQQSVADTGNEPKQAKIHVEQTREPDALPVPGKERASEGKPLDGPAKNRADAFTEAFSAAAATSAEKESTMDEDDGVDSEVESVSTADYDSELETEQRVQPDVKQSVADTGNEPKQAKMEQTREPDALPVPGKERASEGKPLDGPAKNRADAFTEAFSAAAATSAEKESTMDEDDGIDSEVESVSTADYDSELETEQRVQPDVKQSVTDTGNEPKQAKIHVEQTREPDALPVPGKERVSSADQSAKVADFTRVFSTLSTPKGKDPPEQGEEGNSIDSNVGTIALSSNTTPVPQKPDNQKIECKGCSMDEEFVPQGMQMCTRCKLVPYCSLDCMSWHWEHGGHSETCPGLSGAERKANRIANSSHEIPTPQYENNAEALVCNSCGMDQEFVPDGMQMCPKCSTVPYCSDECMQWDWNSGGHKDKCKGASATDKNLQKVVPVTQEGDSDGSVEAFGLDGRVEVPQTKGGILAALSKARAQVAKPPPAAAAAAAASPTYCKACKVEAEFVPEGMKTCPKCLGVSYCSDDCLKWDWESGGHKSICPGLSAPSKRQENDIVIQKIGGSDSSVDAFGANGDSIEVPQTQAGVLAALSRAREEALNKKSPSSGDPTTSAPREAVTSPSHRTRPSQTPSLRDQITGGNPPPPQRLQSVPSPSQTPSLRDQITGGNPPPPPRLQSVPSPTPSTGGLSLRDQITGGNDVQQSRSVVGARPQTVSKPQETSMLKVELERKKRQYNDAMLSKAALERAFSTGSQATAPAPIPPHGGHDGMSSSIESFLSRLEGLLAADRDRTRSQMEGLAQGSNQVPVGALAQSVTELENSIRALIDKSNQAAVEKDALKKAIADATGNQPALFHGSVAKPSSQSRGRVKTAPHLEKKSPFRDGIDASRGKDALMSELNDKWDSIVAESDYFRAQLYQTTRERDQLQADKEASDRLVKEKEALLEEVCKTIVDLENEVSRIYGEQKVLESENEALRGQLDQLTNELAQMHIDKASSDNLLNEKEVLLSKLAKLMMELETEVVKIDGEKKTLENELYQANSALVKHREAKNKLEKSFNNTEKEIQGLRRHLHEVEAALEATHSGYSMGAAVSSKADIPATREYPRHQVHEVSAVDEKTNISRAPATKYTAEAPRRTPSSFSERVASLNLPSQRQDAVGRAIRERTGTPPLPVDISKNSMYETYEPNWITAEPGPAAIPAEEWDRAAPGRQRDGVREPRGKRFLHNYVKPPNSQVEARTDPSRTHQSTNSPKRDRLPPAPSYPPPQLGVHYGSTRQGQSERNQEPRYGESRDSNYRGHVQDDPGLRTMMQPPRKEPATMKNNIVVQLPLTPTEQRMAVIQQRIAQAVEAAKRKASTPTAPQQQPNYYQPNGGGSLQTSLRPQYGKKSVPVDTSRTDKDSIFRDRNENHESRPSSNWWDPHSRPTTQKPGRYQPGQQLPRTATPSHNHPAPRSSTPYKPPVPPNTKFVVYPQGVTGGRNDPAGGYESSRTPRESHQGPPRYIAQGPPRYTMTHHVDPKNLQKVRDERWRKVLGGSSVLSAEH